MNGQNHPWGRTASDVLKLKAARKDAKRRRERSESHKEWQRDNYRLKRGIDIDAPVLSRKECLEAANKARLSGK